MNQSTHQSNNQPYFAMHIIYPVVTSANRASTAHSPCVCVSVCVCAYVCACGRLRAWACAGTDIVVCVSAYACRVGGPTFTARPSNPLNFTQLSLSIGQSPAWSAGLVVSPAVQVRSPTSLSDCEPCFAGAFSSLDGVVVSPACRRVLRPGTS